MIRLLTMLCVVLSLTSCLRLGTENYRDPKSVFCDRLSQRLVLSARRDYSVNTNRRLPPTTRARLMQEYDAAGCIGDLQY